MTEQDQAVKAEMERFFGTLSDRELETVQVALNEWVSECCDAKLKHIEKNLRELKGEIDKVNRKREYLSAQLSSSSDAMKLVDRFMEDGASLVMTLLKDSLSNRCTDLRREIHVLKPEHKLKKKAEFRREKDALLRRREIALMILRLLEKKEESE